MWCDFGATSEQLSCYFAAETLTFASRANPLLVFFVPSIVVVHPPPLHLSTFLRYFLTSRVGAAQPTAQSTHDDQDAAPRVHASAPYPSTLFIHATFRSLSPNRRQGPVWTLKFNAAGNRMATGGQDGKVVIWDLALPPEPTTLAAAAESEGGRTGEAWDRRRRRRSNTVPLETAAAGEGDRANNAGGGGGGFGGVAAPLAPVDDDEGGGGRRDSARDTESMSFASTSPSDDGSIGRRGSLGAGSIGGGGGGGGGGGSDKELGRVGSAVRNEQASPMSRGTEYTAVQDSDRCCSKVRLRVVFFLFGGGDRQAVVQAAQSR